jgi:GR25 family glycosyltransferase involved in LPS biosynthesis
MEYIDTFYYCNLEHRPDRRFEFLGEMEKLGVPAEKIHRIESVYTPNYGALGCGKSQILALKHFLSSGKEICAIFEDDFMFSETKETIQNILTQFFEKRVYFDCLMLGGNILQAVQTELPYLKKVYDGQCCSSYVVTRQFAPLLLQLWEEAIRLQEEYTLQNKKVYHFYCIDIAWKQLQPQSHWFVIEPKFGLQRESYSDIEKKITNYKV